MTNGLGSSPLVELDVQLSPLLSELGSVGLWRSHEELFSPLTTGISLCGS